MRINKNRVVWGALPAMLCISSANLSAAPVPGGTLDPLTVPKYVTPLVIPPALYDDAGAAMSVNISLSEFGQQVLPTSGCTAAQALNPLLACNGDAFPSTTLWGYGDPANPATFHNPAFTVEVTQNTPTNVTWINGLKNADGTFKKHIIQDANGNPLIDQTLHWAAPNQDCRNGTNGPNGETDCAGASGAPYLGPVPMVAHLHGAHVGPASDGYPEAWWLPAATNIDCTNGATYPVTADTADDYDCNGTFFAGGLPGSGQAVFNYLNDQPTSTLWYHDHSLGMTRLNVYAASAGFWLIRTANDGESGLLNGTLPGPAPGVWNDQTAPAADAIREIPLAIQPKSFNADGSQFYPANRAFFEGLGDGQIYGDNPGAGIDPAVTFLPATTSDIAPVWNPEAFFNTMTVNGNTWPVLQVAQAQYRFRVLNASDSRFLNLSLNILKPNGKPDGELPFFQIGSEQGLLPQVVQIETGFATPLVAGQPALKNPSQKVKGTFKDQALLVGPAERPDVIVDFSALPDGTVVRMFNTAPDAPFGGFPDVPADPDTTGQVMQFVVSSALNGLSPTDAFLDPAGTPNPNAATSPYNLALDANPGGDPKLGASSVTRDLALLEEESGLLCVNVDAKTGAITLAPDDPATAAFNVPPLCPDGGVPFAPMAAVLGINGSAGVAGATATLWDDPININPALDAVETWELWNHSADAHPIHVHLVKFEVVNREVIGGAVRAPEPWEAGWKDTVIAYPGEVTRVKALFDMAGLYVWHCHILSHEDNEMMTPFCVGAAGTDCPAVLF